MNLVLPKALPIMFLCLVGGQAFASTPSGNEHIRLEQQQAKTIHGVVLDNAGIPVIGISYDKKLDAFLSYIGMSPALPEMVAGSEELYFSAATRAVMCADELRQTIANSRAMLADLAAEDAKSAMELYRGN